VKGCLFPLSREDGSGKKQSKPYMPTTTGGSLALQKRYAQAHQVVEGIPMHHVLAAIQNVEVELWLLLFQQFGAFIGVGAVFAAKYH